MALSPYDHVRASADAPVPGGVYRVVGVGQDDVTLLRVTDGTGRRVNSGAVERLDRATVETTFEDAEDPDAGFSPSDLVEPFATLPSALRHWLGL